MNDPSPRWVTSRYNFHVPVEGGALLYSAKSGAVLRLDGDDALELARDLSGGRSEVFPEDLPAPLDEQLRAGDFIIPPDQDEVATIRARYWQARRDSPIVLTLTTTQDCNLGCYYCYEARTGERLEVGDVAAVVAHASERLRASAKTSLHVDWYGGEPLMNQDFIAAASPALQELCRRMAVKYSASVISNGTCWPDDIASFVARHRIRQVQISFDGLRDNHDRRRHYRKAYAPSPPSSPFDQTTALVDRLLDHARVDIRLNIDHGNAADVLPFVRFARERGWFSRRFPATIQPARLASFSERSAFMRAWELSLEEFDALRALIRAEVGIEVTVEESEVPDGFPYPRTSVCAALAHDSTVVGADGRLYRCGLQVGETHRAVGRLNAGPSQLLPILDAAEIDPGADESWWRDFDPTTLPTCSRCSFLPICWAGCPKKHLERDAHAIAEQGKYWRENLPRLIAGRAGAQPPPGFAYGEADQFR
jgi:uncharacterized protein